MPGLLPFRDRTEMARAADIFLSACELAAEQLQHAAELLDTSPPLRDLETEEWLRGDVADALASIRFFQQLGGAGRRPPRALTAALRSLAPRRPRRKDPRRQAWVAREWRAMLGAFWMGRALDALAYLDGDMATTAAVVFRNLTDMIWGSVESIPAGAAAVEAIRDYLDDDGATRTATATRAIAPR